MKTTITVSQFRDGFSSKGKFSYEGLEVLFNYLVDLEDDTGVELEFDPVQIRGAFSEGTLAEAIDLYGVNDLDDLESKTLVLLIDDDRIIWEQF